MHPANPDFNRQTTTEGFYGRTEIGKDEAELYEVVNVPMKEAKNFTNFFPTPENNPAYNHLDPMTTAAYIAEENIVNGQLQGQIDLETQTITLRS